MHTRKVNRSKSIVNVNLLRLVILCGSREYALSLSKLLTHDSTLPFSVSSRPHSVYTHLAVVPRPFPPPPLIYPVYSYISSIIYRTVDMSHTVYDPSSAISQFLLVCIILYTFLVHYFSRPAGNGSAYNMNVGD